MRLAIDAVGAKHGGAASVLLDILRAALGNPCVKEVTVFCSPAGMRRFSLPCSPRLREVGVRLGEAGPVGRIAWQEMGMSRAVAGADVLLCLSGGGLSRGACPSVNLVQQSLPFLPEALRALAPRDRLRMAVLRSAMRRSCRASKRVIVQTPTMRDALVQAFGLGSDRVSVVEPAPAAVPASFGAPELAALRAAPARRRLIYVGNGSAYKNLDVLVRGLQRVRAVIPDAQLFVTLAAGHPLAAMPGLVALGYLRPEVLAEAYQLATALVMPSLAETVGLPMLEAAMAGVTVVAADRPYARDVCQDAAVYFDPLNPVDLGARLVEVLSSDALRAERGARGQALVARRVAQRPYEEMVRLVVEAGGRRE